MLTLHTSLPSPYGRKVRIVIDQLGLTDSTTIMPVNTQDPADPIRGINPLGKIPALVPDGEPAIFDSRVIVDYLDSRFGDGSIIPREQQARYRMLTLAALAEGVNDALLLITYERRYRDEEQVGPRWLELQMGKVERGFEAIIQALDEYKAPGIAATSLACALAYADWRKQIDWRSRYPALVQWLDDYAASVPGFALTTIPPDAP